jgi:hypothetical protein
LSFLAVKHTAQKVWVWCKNHTGVLLAATWALVLLFVLRRDDSAAREVLEIRKESHKKEMKAIEKAHAEEAKIREENLETFHKTISKIEEEYEKENRVLTRDKKKRVKKLVEDFHDNPEELTEIVSIMFGIPNEDKNSD